MTDYLEIAGRCTLALVFLASAYSKVRTRLAFAAFVDGLRDMHVSPLGAVRAVASLVVATEAAIPVLLAVPTTALAGLLLALVALTAFTGAVLAVLARGTPASCPCFGSSPVRFGRRHVVRNAILLAVALVAVMATAGGAGPVEVGGVAVAAAAALVLAILIVSFDDLTDLVAGFSGPGRR